MESPLYVVKQDSSRILVPEVLKLLLLAGTMYFGVYMNFMILRKPMTMLHHSIIIVILLILVLIQAKLSHVKAANIQYAFFQNRIEEQGDMQAAIYAANITAVYLKRNIMDIIFGTGSIYLEPGFVIRAVKGSDQINAYVQRLVQLARQSASYASPQTFRK